MLVAATWPTLLLGQRATVQPAIYPWEVEPTVEVMQTMSQSGDCVPTSPAAAPQCSDLTDNLCDVLWSKERQGKLKVSDGAVMMGKSGKSDAAIERIEDLRALLASEPRLPADLKKRPPLYWLNFASYWLKRKTLKSGIGTFLIGTQSGKGPSMIRLTNALRNATLNLRRSNIKI